MLKIFDDIGQKIKLVAEIIFCLLTGAGIVAGSILMVIGITQEHFGWLVPIGILGMVVVALVAWFSSYLLYGFGELVDRTSEIAKHIKKSGIDLRPQQGWQAPMPIQPMPIQPTPIQPIPVDWSQTSDEERIKNYKALHDSGIITDAEYQAAIERLKK